MHTTMGGTRGAWDTGIEQYDAGEWGNLGIMLVTYLAHPDRHKAHGRMPRMAAQGRL